MPERLLSLAWEDASELCHLLEVAWGVLRTLPSEGLLKGHHQSL